MPHAVGLTSLVDAMTLSEQLSLLSGQDFWRLFSIGCGLPYGRLRLGDLAIDGMDVAVAGRTVGERPAAGWFSAMSTRSPREWRGRCAS